MNRRSFLTTAAAGLLLGARPMPFQQEPRRRQAMLSGRRVRTVDVHAHTTVPAVLEIVKGTPLEAAVKNSAGGALAMGLVRLEAMDAQGIDVQALSINPYWYAADRELARDLIGAQNDGLARMCRAQPDRFVALATVAMQHPDLAAEQLESGVTKLGLRGGSLGATVNGEELAAARFDPFWAAAERLDVPIFIHPQGVPELRDRLQGNGFLTNVIGNPLETTIALSHLIFEGVLDRFPRLKICAAHAGGYLPSYIGRSDQGCVAFPQNCPRPIRKRPSEYLKTMYFDSMVFSGEGLRHLVAECGAGQILLGTDYPFPWTTTAVDHVVNAPGLTDAEREMILGGNAAKLLKI
jgi:aminocarboxymuconate-semialdehyde decarboxylase